MGLCGAKTAVRDARALFGGLLRAVLEEERAQRRQGEGDAVPEAVAADGRGADAAEVALPAAPVGGRIRVQELLPEAREGHADLVVMPRHRREVEGGDHQV